ncbi:MAG: hypothetical protein LUH82_06625 [Clostridiales bacterium]|nr:hypothetical protein [Clostridiales bacterium]
MVELKGYRVSEFNIKNSTLPNSKLQLKNRVKYNVNYLKSKNICVGAVQLSVGDSVSDNFEIKLCLTAEFSFDPAAQKADIHKKSFDLIFPVIRVMVNTVTAAMGMPGLVLPPMHLDKGIMISTEAPPDEE